jgi:hypothetical protein
MLPYSKGVPPFNSGKLLSDVYSPASFLIRIYYKVALDTAFITVSIVAL